MLQVDRFDNHVQFGYEEPVSSLESAKLAYIQDNYGNVYRFSYEPGAMIIHSPDTEPNGFTLIVKGVTSIENPLNRDTRSPISTSLQKPDSHYGNARRADQ